MRRAALGCIWVAFGMLFVTRKMKSGSRQLTLFMLANIQRYIDYGQLILVRPTNISFTFTMQFCLLVAMKWVLVLTWK